MAPVSRWVCVCVCVCVYVYRCVTFCVNICSHVAKFWKNHLYGIDKFQSNGTISFWYSLTLTFIFKVKIVAFFLFCENLANGERQSKHYHCHQMEKQVFAFRMTPLRMLYILILTSIFKVTNFEMWISRYINGSHKRLKIFAKFKRIFNPMFGGQYKFIFFPNKFCHLFRYLPDGEENTYSQVSRKMFD